MKLGICGYATSGKDAVADILVAEMGFQRASWADPLRRDIWVLNPPVGFILGREVSYREALAHGYTEAKAAFPHIRRMLQVYGTEVHRELDPDYWVKRTLSSVADDVDLVIPDTRFQNEAEAVDHLLLVVRPGVGPVNDHPSDAGLAFPYARSLIVNDGTLGDLEAKVKSWWGNFSG